MSHLYARGITVTHIRTIFCIILKSIVEIAHWSVLPATQNHCPVEVMLQRCATDLKVGRDLFESITSLSTRDTGMLSIELVGVSI